MALFSQGWLVTVAVTVCWTVSGTEGGGDFLFLIAAEIFPPENFCNPGRFLLPGSAANIFFL